MVLLLENFGCEICGYFNGAVSILYDAFSQFFVFYALDNVDDHINLPSISAFHLFSDYAIVKIQRTNFYV